MSDYNKTLHYVNFTAPDTAMLEQIKGLMWNGEKFTFSQLIPLHKGETPIEIWGTRYDISKKDNAELKKNLKVKNDQINIVLTSYDGGLDVFFNTLTETLKGLVVTDVLAQISPMVPIEVHSYQYGERKHVKDYKNHFSYIISGLEKTPEECIEYCVDKYIVMDEHDIKTAANAIVYETSMKHIIEDDTEKEELEKKLIELGDNRLLSRD
ncbi:MAG: hypothetical protein ACRCZ9_12205 [Fusobacteriaceae bacterium]